MPSRPAGPQVMLGSFHDGLHRNRSLCTVFQVKSGSYLIDSIDDPPSFRGFFLIQLIRQRGEIDARRRPSRSHLNPAFIPILQLNPAALENEQSGAASLIVDSKRVARNQLLMCDSMHTAGHQILRQANDG
jgi:hypothetical protein